MPRLPNLADLGGVRPDAARPIGGADVSGYERGVGAGLARFAGGVEGGISRYARGVEGGLSEVERGTERFSRAGQAIERGVEKFGEGVSTAGAGAVAFQLDKGRAEYADAHSSAMVGQIDTYKAMQSDPDYKTMPDRYGKSIREIYTKAADGISNPALRQRFISDTQSNVAQFDSNVASHAQKLYGDAKITTNGQFADTLINDSVNGTAEGAGISRGQALDAYNHSVDGMVAERVVSPERGADMKRKFAIRYVTADVMSLMDKDPAEAVRRLEKPDAKSIYSLIPADTRLHLLTQARSANAGEQYSVKQAVEDDVASILKTGEGVPNITAARIRSAYGPKGEKAVIEWQEARADAAKIYTGTHDMDTLTPDAISERIEHYQPKAGVQGFGRAQKVYDAVYAEGERVLKQRYDDPAAAVAKNKDVQAASANANESDPASFRGVAKARMDAQAKLGIPEEVRSPITKQEALRLTTPLARMLPGQEREVLTEMAKDFQQRFGEDADSAFEYALRARKINTETAQAAARVMRKLGQGAPIGGDEARRADQGNETVAAEAAVNTPVPPRSAINANPGRVTAQGARSAEAPAETPAPAQPAAAPKKEGAKAPPAADIIALRKNPGLSARFDAKYGKGAADKILKSYPLTRPASGPQE